MKSVLKLRWLLLPAMAGLVACNTPTDDAGRPINGAKKQAPQTDPNWQEGDENPLVEVGVGVAGARKGSPGAQNGQGDFCDNGNCNPGEGDCDSGGQCAGFPTNTCLTDNGGRYALLTGLNANQQDDHCAPALCNNRVQDVGNGETGIDCGGPCGLCDPICELPVGHQDRCTYHCQCLSEDGDCDSNDACVGGTPAAGNTARCVADVGFRFLAENGQPMPPTNDVCLASTCANRVHDVGETENGVDKIDCGGPCGPCNCGQQQLVPGGECTPSCPCAGGVGDCDSDLDCQAGLKCVDHGAVDTCDNVQQNVTGLHIVDIGTHECDYACIRNFGPNAVDVTNWNAFFDDSSATDTNVSLNQNIFGGTNIMPPFETRCVQELGAANQCTIRPEDWGSINNIFFSSTRGGTLRLCNGSCAVAANIVDAHRWSGPEAAPALPAPVVFSPNPQTVTPDEVNIGYQRQAFGGANPTFLLSDWTYGPVLRPEL